MDQLFEITSPKKRFNANEIQFDGKYPYVARGCNNNGIRGYITEDEQYLNNGNTISFGQDTVTVFYQKHPYFTGDKIKIMTFQKGELTMDTACYFITAIRKAFQGFIWGQSSFNEKVINNMEILLPVAENGDIDYGFIMSFITAQKKMVIKDILDCKRNEISACKRICCSD